MGRRGNGGTSRTPSPTRGVGVSIICRRGGALVKYDMVYRLFEDMVYTFCLGSLFKR